MFTGVVKLAQIDDYISPSQNCIQPKIMKKDNVEQKATITLNDCLACSGCITSAESILIEQMSIQKFISALKNQTNILLFISPQSLLAISKFYKVSPDTFMHNFSELFRKQHPNVKKMFNLQNAIQICHELIYEQFLEKRKQNSTVLCSECPGWVCYAQKTLTTATTELMSGVKSPQQLLGGILRKIYGNDFMIVSIMPCYDKKLEAIRFEIEQKVKEVDLTLATTQLVDLINQLNPNFQEKIQQKNANEKYYFDSIESQNQKIEFIEDQTSNGYIHYILKRQNIKEFEKKQIRNSDFIEYCFKNEEGKQVKMAKCYGFRNIQKIVQAIKKKKCVYSYVEIMACPGGCFSGGGQPKYEQTKPKQIALHLMQMAKEYLSQIKESEKLQKMKSLVSEENRKVRYRPIQKSLNEVVMNW